LVAAEVRQPKKNLLRALVLGTAGVTLIYLLVNFAFIHVMGLEGLRASKVPAADALRAALGDDWLGRGAGRAISLLICIACLGAINGMVFTGARVFYATGREHPLFAYAARFNPRSGSPVHALALQGLVTLAAIIGFGISGRGFENMIVFSAPVFWLFFLMVGVSLFVLRRRDPNAPRPYRVVGYPVTPLLFCLSSLLMLYSSLDYALKHASTAAYWAVALLVVGFAVAYWPRPRA
jgi:amino acid transporter